MTEKIQEFITYLTFRCNYSCKMCTQDGLPQIKELTGKEWDKIFADIEKKYPNSTMVFLGGEPTMHKDFIEIIERATCHNLHKHLVTNAFFLEPYLPILKKHNCGITISCDGIGETHDKIRNHKGAYKKIIKAINKINELNKDLLPGEKPLWFNINFVILPDNIEEIYTFIDTMLEYNPHKIVLSHPRHISKKQSQNMQDILMKLYSNGNIQRLTMRDEIKFEKQYTEQLNSVIENIKKTYDPAVVKEHPDFTEIERLSYYNEEKVQKIRSNEMCLSPYKIPFIYPDGTVSSCLYNILGNLQKESVSQIWKNETAEKTRIYLNEKHHFPVCTRCTCFYKKDEF